MTINFETMNEFQKRRIAYLIEKDKEKKERLQIIKEQNERYKEIHEITEDIVVVELNNPFKDEELSKHDSYYEAYVNGKRVVTTGTFSLDAAILVAITYKYEEPNAYPYLAKLINLELY